jgi:hypothetical protein
VGLTFLQVILYTQKQFSLFKAALTQATGMNLGQELQKSLCSHCYWWEEIDQLVRKDIEKVLLNLISLLQCGALTYYVESRRFCN